MTVASVYWLSTSCKKVKASHTRYRALGPELIQVEAVSPQVTVSHPPGGRLPLLSLRPWASYSHLRASVTNQYNLIPANGR